MFLVFAAAAQESKRTLEMISDNLVKTTTYTSGKIDQRGYYIVIGSELFKHGKWKIYSNGNVVGRAMFNTGQLVWIDAYEGRVTFEQIKVRKLERKVEHLERLILASQP